MNVIWILAGIVLLYGGGQLLVNGASALARAWGLGPMVIGLTVVAFGTSAPELAASLAAALDGAPEIAAGNVVGSNIANIALILGVTALVRPLHSEARFLRREMPIMVGAALLLALLFADGRLGRVDGAVFLVALAAYLIVLFRGEELPTTHESFARGLPAPPRPGSLAAPLVRTLAGLALLVLGAQALVAGATALARMAGVPELLIGLSVVAVGTSLPELAASVVAASKRAPEIALGNVVGSNVFNVLGILGVTAAIRPIEVPLEALAPDLAVMMAFSVVLWVFLATGLRLGRREAGLLLALYAAFMAYRFLG
ncbi:MAG: calcium/sodium antiporter [Trueperaceae bacterium]|nr:calcium/sodium antiporter [Trueperaceae bacterium]